MILCYLYKMIRVVISLLMPADKPRREWTMDDVKAALTEKAKEIAADLDWDKSIVALCRVLDISPSFPARNDMYLKAGGKGVYTGSEEQNIWLHGQVMESLAKHGFGD